MEIKTRSRSIMTKNKPRIFYLVPGYSKIRLDHETHWQGLKRLLFSGIKQIPSGGVKIIYQHCEILSRNGYETYAVHLGDFKIDWFPHDVSAVKERDAIQNIRESDILICPEIIPLAAQPFKCQNRISFIQGWAIVDRVVGPNQSYEDFGFTHLLACSHYNKSFISNRSGLSCSVVVNGIDLDHFCYRPEIKENKRVLYLNRRNVNDAKEAIKMLEPEIRRTAKFIELENRYDENGMIKHYQKSDIFISTGYPEGFGLPALEAMACGCAVVGFTGGGGTEFMKDGDSAFIAPDGDIQKLSQCLKKVLTDEMLKERIREGGLIKTKEFSMKRMENELLAFMSKFN
jgi:glycosyltransferase involved in cell wall biosynthesis